MTLIWRTETIETEVVCGFACNMCGLVVQPGVGVPTVEELTSRVTGLIGAVVHAGYDAEHLTDGVTYSFSLCEKCLSDLFNQFKVPVTVKDINDVGDLFDNLGMDARAIELAAAAITFTAEEVKGWNTRDDGMPYDDVSVTPTAEEIEDTLGPACSVEEMRRRSEYAKAALEYVMTPMAERDPAVRAKLEAGIPKEVPDVDVDEE